MPSRNPDPRYPDRYLTARSVLLACAFCVFGTGGAETASGQNPRSFEEEQQMQAQVLGSGGSRADAIMLQQKAGQAEPENKGRPHFGDYVDALIGDSGSEKNPPPVHYDRKGVNIMRDRDAAANAVVDRQFSDAVEKARLDEREKKKK